MPAWIHDRQERIRKRNPEMPEGEAWAIATQQSHALGKSPKGYGTAKGRAVAKKKFKTPGDDQKTAQLAGFLDELAKIAGLVLVLLFLGCAGHPVYTVYTSPGSAAFPAQQLPGIPFYQLEPVEVNTTSYDQPWAEVSLAVTTKAPGGVESTAHHVRYTEDLQYAADLYARFGKAPDAAVAVHTVGTEYVANTSVKLSTAEPAQLAPKDMLQLRPIAVDRKRMQVVSLIPYYINSTVPLGGTGSSTVVLGADGSLTSATSQVTDQLPMTIASAVGSLGAAALGPLVASAMSPPPMLAGPTGATPWPVRAELKMGIVHRIYTVTVSRPVALGDAACDVPYALESPLIAMPSCRVGLSVEVMRPPVSK